MGATLYQPGAEADARPDPAVPTGGRSAGRTDAAVRASGFESMPASFATACLRTGSAIREPGNGPRKTVRNAPEPVRPILQADVR